MNPSEYPILIITLIAVANTARGLFVTPAGAIAGAGALVAGVCHEDVDLGEPLPVVTDGIAYVKSGGAVTLGSKVKSDANGKAVTYDTGEVAGVAMSATTGADQWIAVKL